MSEHSSDTERNDVTYPSARHFKESTLESVRLCDFK